METYRDNSKAAGAQRRQSVSSRSGSAHGTSRARRSAQGGAAVRDSSGSGAARAADRLRSNGRGRAVNEGGRSVSTRRATGSRRHRSNFMRYAADNRVVQTIYAITTGPWRFAFYGVVAAAIALSVYFPVRDLYAAYRTGDILERQLAVRESYNKTLETEVNKLLSTEGIEDAARRNLGLVMPGEHAVEVIGLEDEAGDSSSDGASGDSNGSADASDASADQSGDAADDEGDASDAQDAASTDSGASGSATGASSDPNTSAEVEAAEQAVANDAPWYIKVLDAFFFYQGVEGQTVSSTGN